MAFAGIHSKAEHHFVLVYYMCFCYEKMMSLWLQEKSYSMEGNAEAESSARERAKKLESCYF